MSMDMPPISTQEKVLDFIERSTLANGYAPSVREICDAIGLKSTSTVHGHLLRLEKKGLIKRSKQKPRALAVHNDAKAFPSDTVSVPILGAVTAGMPILATENIEDYVSLPASMLGNGEHFILKIRGESMIYAGIMDGDFVVVKKQNDAFNGDIVVALLGDEATVKRFYREKNMIRLQPENTAMQPIFTRDVVILGKVVSLYRLF